MIAEETPDVHLPPLLLNTRSSSIEHIRHTKRRLDDDPRSSLAWLDLARSYTILGQNGHAERAVRAATNLAPNNRQVLRSASRFYLHIDRPDLAHSLLQDNPRTPRDPWLLAAELAVAQVAGKGPRFYKVGKRLVEAKSFAPEYLTELHSALGMLELRSGSVRAARKNLRASLLRATENSVAQARWASTQIAGIDITEEAYSLPSNYEARCWRYLQSESWSDAASQCVGWILDEPYSARPALVGSFIGLMLVEEPQMSAKFAQAGLSSSPHSAMLRNNLTVAHAYCGNLEAAFREFSAIPFPLPIDLPRYTCIATAGLLYFRTGDIRRGRELYQASERIAPNSAKSVVRLFRLREEIEAATPLARELLEAEKKIVQKEDDSYRKRMMYLIEANLRSRDKKHVIPISIGENIHYDRATNIIHRLL